MWQNAPTWHFFETSLSQLTCSNRLAKSQSTSRANLLHDGTYFYRAVGMLGTSRCHKLRDSLFLNHFLDRLHWYVSLYSYGCHLTCRILAPAALHCETYSTTLASSHSGHGPPENLNLNRTFSWSRFFCHFLAFVGRCWLVIGLNRLINNLELLSISFSVH